VSSPAAKYRSADRFADPHLRHFVEGVSQFAGLLRVMLAVA